MDSKKCAICTKVAYPLESVSAVDKVFHKGCFKCTVCQLTLNLKNYKGFQGQIYCGSHTPTVKSTSVTDSVSMKQALNAPRKTAEGLGGVQKGTGEKPSVGIDTITTQNALKAPKRTGESGVHKGHGHNPGQVEGSESAESPSEYQSQSYDAPAEEAPQEYYEAPAEEAPQEYYEAPAEEAPQEESEW